ncbi:MAG TPA: UDP-glucuronic acid decarboxylase family protein [Nitrospiraceae bacterium]|jgi:dTDP-glucose 4,6-dehydratase|nr:UDP-glucuronic acid decarboxylase family protein [Nitrospiraceae bacterium]
MRVLITGGAGFLGSHLCDALIAQGHEVVCMDNFITGRPENIAHLLGHARFSFVKYNVCDYLHIDGPLDAVLHFASPASPQDYLELPIATLKVGALGTHKTLGLAKAKGARFLLASTSEVYGDPLVNPQPESYWGNVNPISPRGVYDEAKRFAEALTMAYHRYHGLDTRIVRIFNTYGPRMREHDGRVVSNFVVQALQGKPLTVFGDGTQTRSFCYVDDLIRGIVALLLAESDRSVDERTDRARFLTAPSSTEPASIHDPVNLGNPRELTVMEIAELVLKLTGSSSAIQYHPLPVDDPKVRRPDIRRAQALLGWEPHVKLEEGLLKTIEYFRRVLEGRGQAGSWQGIKEFR